MKKQTLDELISLPLVEIKKKEAFFCQRPCDKHFESLELFADHIQKAWANGHRSPHYLDKSIAKTEGIFQCVRCSVLTDNPERSICDICSGYFVELSPQNSEPLKEAQDDDCANSLESDSVFKPARRIYRFERLMKRIATAIGKVALEMLNSEGKLGQKDPLETLVRRELLNFGSDKSRLSSCMKLKTLLWGPCDVLLRISCFSTEDEKELNRLTQVPFAHRVWLAKAFKRFFSPDYFFKWTDNGGYEGEPLGRNQKIFLFRNYDQILYECSSHTKDPTQEFLEVSRKRFADNFLNKTN
jgi:hypothetical protein